MKQKTHKKNRFHLVAFLKDIVRQPIVKKALGYLVVALIGYVVNHIQTDSTINKLKTDNTDLTWAVDYFRK